MLCATAKLDVATAVASLKVFVKRIAVWRSRSIVDSVRGSLLLMCCYCKSPTTVMRFADGCPTERCGSANADIVAVFTCETLTFIRHFTFFARNSASFRRMRRDSSVWVALDRPFCSGLDCSSHFRVKRAFTVDTDTWRIIGFKRSESKKCQGIMTIINTITIDEFTSTLIKTLEFTDQSKQLLWLRLLKKRFTAIAIVHKKGNVSQ